MNAKGQRLKAELSLKLQHSDFSLQPWFCLLDRACIRLRTATRPARGPHVAAMMPQHFAASLALPPVGEVNRQFEMCLQSIMRNQETLLRGLKQLAEYCARQQPEADAITKQISRLTLQVNRHPF